MSGSRWARHLLAGAVHYAPPALVGRAHLQREQITSVLIFLIGILPSFPVYAFFYGLFGGWDDDTLGELRHAVNLSGMMRPLAWLFWRATALGARLSPLHGRSRLTSARRPWPEARD